jgi:2-polyprenyl-6-methoxyphenol hydroxylase-like FAD-dependent oxidoreductase
VGFRVAVVGAGLGGLCLAQGLRREGVDVTVYERDASLEGRRQGYRLHLDARAGVALARCLPAVRASRQAETETGTRRSSLRFWLYRKLSR